MDKGLVQAYYGMGRGKTSLALGRAIHSASTGNSVIIIQFLQEKDINQINFVKRLEPEIKLFRFEKSEASFKELSDEAKLEELQNIRNGLNFAKKVLTTKECNVLILDGLLGLFDHQMIRPEELDILIESKSEDTEIIFTGSHIKKQMFGFLDEIVRLETIKSREHKMELSKIFY